MKIVKSIIIVAIVSLSGQVLAKSHKFESKQAILVVSNCGTDTWKASQLDCADGGYRINYKDSKASNHGITKESPGVFFMYQSRIHGPNCKLTLKSGSKSVTIKYQQNFVAAEAGDITLKATSGSQYVVSTNSYTGSYAHGVPGVGEACLDSKS
ncbi:hypothetical protein [Vibrio nomapromontoriensis]|uniref:hypothetical protein n=1 Tax=Vibrio nomapromontoriensis TaxID=2910246 RepID=UPI003D150C55